MNRRDFLTRSTLALAGGLILGDEAVEAFDRLTHRRKSFASAGIPITGPYGVLHVRTGPDAPWVEFDRAPLVDSRVVFRRRVPAHYEHGRQSLVIPETTAAITATIELSA